MEYLNLKYIIDNEVIIMIEFDKDILKSTPDYEDYDENVAQLSIGDLRDLGLIKCGGCCSTKSSDKKMMVVENNFWLNRFLLKVNANTFYI